MPAKVVIFTSARLAPGQPPGAHIFPASSHRRNDDSFPFGYLLPLPFSRRRGHASMLTPQRPWHSFSRCDASVVVYLSTFFAAEAKFSRQHGKIITARQKCFFASLVISAIVISGQSTVSAARRYLCVLPISLDIEGVATELYVRIFADLPYRFTSLKPTSQKISL